MDLRFTVSTRRQPARCGRQRRLARPWSGTSFEGDLGLHARERLIQETPLFDRVRLVRSGRRAGALDAADCPESHSAQQRFQSKRRN